MVNSTRALPDLTLAGKTALVTGASRGLGHTIALALAEAGADVAVTSRTRAQLDPVLAEIRARGHKAFGFAVDVREVAALRRLAQEAEEALGRVDVLVNNAGMNIPQRWHEVTEEAWDLVMDTNAKGAFFAAQAFAPAMVRRGYGRIINIGSQMALVGFFERSAYCASKGALSQLTKVLAVELAQTGVTVNCVAPTFLETAMTRPMFEKDPGFRAEVLRRIPMGRLGRPEEVAGAVVFLASEAASLITGHTLLVDGGWVAW
jgi:NAD(P)-dependent dehydrogenase (short-subunit alcohol dehydrogenase family)